MDMKALRKIFLIITVGILLACQAGLAEPLDAAIEFNADSISNALAVSDEEIYLCGLKPDGCWMKKTNVRNEELSKWEFGKEADIGTQPVIQCLNTADGSIIAGLVDSDTQKATAAVLKDGKVQYYPLPADSRVNLWSICADYNGLSIISSTDSKSERTIRYTHVSADGITESFETGRSATDDVVIADSFACATQDSVYVLRMTKIEGVVNNCNRELVAFDHEGRQQWQVMLPSDVVIKGIKTDNDTLYLYGFQRLETNNRALLMCYGTDGDFRWTQNFDNMEQVLYMGIKDKKTWLAGQKEDFPEQWVFHCLVQDGTLVCTGSAMLPEAYNVFLGLGGNHINMIENYEEKPCLWQIECPAE